MGVFIVDIADRKNDFLRDGHPGHALAREAVAALASNERATFNLPQQSSKFIIRSVIRRVLRIRSRFGIGQTRELNSR